LLYFTFIIKKYKTKMSRTLSENSVDKDPFVQFDKWYREHLTGAEKYPDSFSLGTASADGTVSVRTVLLKGFDSRGFVFFTNYKSKKGRQLSENPNAAMLFYWPHSSRQVRIEGRVEKISDEESELYFNSRPRESRIGAWASSQSTIIPGKDHLDELVKRFSSEFKGKPIPKPPHWGGFRIIPGMFEFWQEGKHRLHDRLVYAPGKNGWTIKRLAP
jgi:pyridoxamine 5'-phosphate oxidase